MTKTSEQHPKRGPTRGAGPGSRTASVAPNAELASRECRIWAAVLGMLTKPEAAGDSEEGMRE